MNSKIMKSSTSGKKTITEEIKGGVSEVIRQIRKLIKEGNARRLIIRDKKGKILFQTQLTVGVAGTALVTAMAPIISAISLFALFMNDIKIIVEKYPEEETGNGDEADEYEIEAEYIEIRDEEDIAAEQESDAGQESGPEEEPEAGQKKEKEKPGDQTEKTVGKKEEEKEEEEGDL